ncbi:hypothetical protein [Agromyces laixinhei]|uniref:hypothetical protein n=1 Tax=Agromyces laixinhei TaxID=2585717 RepID=UPI001117670B|nr:hypothetical protein [Agromyces laixinhei]
MPDDAPEPRLAIQVRGAKVRNLKGAWHDRGSEGDRVAAERATVQGDVIRVPRGRHPHPAIAPTSSDSAGTRSIRVAPPAAVCLPVDFSAVHVAKILLHAKRLGGVPSEPDPTNPLQG